MPLLSSVWLIPLKRPALIENGQNAQRRGHRAYSRCNGSLTDKLGLHTRYVADSFLKNNIVINHKLGKCTISPSWTATPGLRIDTSDLPQNPLDYADSNTINPGGLGSRHAVFDPGADVRNV